MRAPAVKGTPEQRADLRKQVQAANRVNHTTRLLTEALQAGADHRAVVILCNTILALSKRRLTGEGRKVLQDALNEAIKKVDKPMYRKEEP